MALGNLMAIKNINNVDNGIPDKWALLLPMASVMHHSSPSKISADPSDLSKTFTIHKNGDGRLSWHNVACVLNRLTLYFYLATTVLTPVLMFAAYPSIKSHIEK